MLHARRGQPLMGTVQVETGGGGHTPELGRHMLRGQFRMGFVLAGLSSNPVTRATNSPAGMARRSLSRLGFHIVLGW